MWRELAAKEELHSKVNSLLCMRSNVGSEEQLWLRRAAPRKRRGTRYGEELTGEETVMH